MIRFSLVIQNTKKEYLICKCPLMERDEFSYEFLGGEIIGNTIPMGIDGMHFILHLRLSRLLQQGVKLL